MCDKDTHHIFEYIGYLYFGGKLLKRELTINQRDDIGREFKKWLEVTNTQQEYEIKYPLGWFEVELFGSDIDSLPCYKVKITLIYTIRADQKDHVVVSLSLFDKIKQNAFGYANGYSVVYIRKTDMYYEAKLVEKNKIYSTFVNICTDLTTIVKLEDGKIFRKLIKENLIKLGYKTKVELIYTILDTIAYVQKDKTKIEYKITFKNMIFDHHKEVIGCRLCTEFPKIFIVDNREFTTEF